MALPSDVQLVTVTCGSAYSFFGDDVTVEVEVEPVLGGNLKHLVHKAGGTVMAKSKQKFTGTPGQPASFTVPDPSQAETWVDGSGNFFSGWPYSATITVRPAGSIPVVWIKAFTVAPGQTSIDLDLVPNGQVGGGVSGPVPAVTSVNGKAGAVVIPEAEPLTSDAVAANLTVEAVDAKLPERLTASGLSATTVDYARIKLGAETLPGSLTFVDLQAAADAARVNGRRLWAAGTLSTDQTLVIRSDADLGGLTINYTGTDVAVRVGESTSPLFRKQGTLPRVADALNITAGSWVDSKIGIQLLNNDSCIWFIPHVKNFGVGVDEVGDGRGHAYNTFTFGHLENNKVNHQFRAVGVGWANQNTHIGGRLGHNSGEGVNVTGCYHVRTVAADVNAINNNTWLGSSLEGDAPQFHADITGTANMFINCRWEAPSGPKVRWGAGAVNNQILYGYTTNTITQTHGVGASRNHVVAATRTSLPTSLGTLYESTAGNDGLVDAVMGSGGIAAGTDPATGYAIKRSANNTRMKRPADAFDRVRLDHVNGRVYLGDGVAEPTSYIGSAGSLIRFETTTSTTAPAAGAAAALPATPAGYMSVYVGGAVRKIPYY